MKHRTFAILLLCPALLLSACQQVTPPATDGTTLPSSGSDADHTHCYVAAEVVEPRPCTEDGYTLMVCSCGLSYKGNHTKAPGHSYQSQVVSPTATEGGYTLHTCSRCGFSYKTDATDPVTSTEPTLPDSPVSTLDPALWYVADPQYPSYEEFITQDRTLTGYYSNKEWTVQHGDTLMKFEFDWLRRDGLLVIQRSVANKSDGVYVVPGCEKLTEYNRIGCDGHDVYLRSSDEVIRVNLLTGGIKPILSLENIRGVTCFDGLVLIYLEEKDDLYIVKRMYLPTMTVDVLYEGIPTDTMMLQFSLYSYSPSTPLVWTAINPKMVAKLKQELADPNSIYKVNNFNVYENDYTSIWGNTDLGSIDTCTLEWLMWDIQTHSGIHTWIKYTYNPVDGSLTEKTGVIDMCTFGSGYAHDHFDHQYYDVEPKWKVSDPAPISTISLPEDPEKMYEEDIYAQYDVPYSYSGGTVYSKDAKGNLTRVFDIALVDWQLSPDYIYGITPDNTIVQVSYDGTVRNILYTQQEGKLSYLFYGSGRLYFLIDNTTLMEIDIPAKTYRTLMEIPSFSRMYLDAPGEMFIETSRGLSNGMYVANFSDLTIRDGHRL